MDLMAIRRSLLMMQETGLDTSPRILAYGYKYDAGNPNTKPPVANEDSAISDIYTYTISSVAQTIVAYGCYGPMIVYKNNGTTYMDYWTLNSTQSEQSRKCVNAQSDGLAFSIALYRINGCYAYIQETGQILFAGKDSIYYGHTNISELT